MYRLPLTVALVLTTTPVPPQGGCESRGHAQATPATCPWAWTSILPTTRIGFPSLR
jgi:hypothetical protein